MALRNDLLLRAARGEHTERPPVWLMRQAGRILPEYRALRSKVSDFRDLVTNPELVCEVTLQPVDNLGVDAAILFSDILVIPEAMGLPYRMIPGKGPHFDKTVRTTLDSDKLRIAEPEEDLAYVLEGIRLIRRALGDRVPLIGFAGAPWTIFCYMVEGGGSKTFSQARRLLYANPQMAHRLLSRITQSTINYLRAQVRAGVDLVQVFDSWAGILPPAQYRNFALPYLRLICEAVDGVPITVFAKDAGYALEDLAGLNCRVIGLDWHQDPHEARRRVGMNRTLQGNLDPCVLYAEGKEIERITKDMLGAFAPGPHIANLGHGVYPDTPLDGVKRFVDTVKAFRYASAVSN